MVAESTHLRSLNPADTMENLISLVNRLQRACTALGDHGEDSALPTLWDALPSIAVVGGQVHRSPASFEQLVFKLYFHCYYVSLANLKYWLRIILI